MRTITTITHDELLEKLAQSKDVESLDLGAVQIHLVNDGHANHLLVENPSDYNESALVAMSA